MVANHNRGSENLVVGLEALSLNNERNHRKTVSFGDNACSYSFHKAKVIKISSSGARSPESYIAPGPILLWWKLRNTDLCHHAVATATGQPLGKSIENICVRLTKGGRPGLAVGGIVPSSGVSD